MRFRKRRVRRIRDELRQWLRSRYGLRARYAQVQIDAGRQDLGFDGIDDALIAYTLFGPDLLPGFSDSLGLALSAEDFGDMMSIATEDLGGITEFFAGAE